MKKISLILFSCSLVFAGANHGGKCKEKEVLLRSGTCVTDCVEAYINKSRREACIKNQLGPGKHNYYAELPSDCIDCVLNRKILEASKNQKNNFKGHRR